MDGREYVDGYGYMYDPTQVYYPDPAMQQHQGYYNQGHQYTDWGWQPQGFVAPQQPPQFYGGYPQAAVGYSYGYGNNDGILYNQAGYQGYELQENTGRRSKHSYSQNRTRNRPRQDQKQSGDNGDNTFNRNLDSDITAVSRNQNNNAKDESVGISNQTTKSVGSYKNVSEPNLAHSEHQSEHPKPNERWKNRGSRFQGTDHRTKQFDKEKQQLERQKNYNKSYVTGEKSLENVSESTSDRTCDNVEEESIGANIEDTKGARPKSYKDNRGNSTKGNYRNNKESVHQVDRGIDKSNSSEGGDAPQKENSYSRGAKNQQNVDGKEGGNETDETYDNSNARKDNAGRKKKKDFQQVYSSSSPREWQSKSSQYTSQREAFDRYNFRGQDYNKRHKDPTAAAMERGGDRTKLSANYDASKDENADGVSVERKDDCSADSEVKKKPGYTGPARGSRYKNRGRVDESQRGVLIEQLSRGSYECMVCCETVRSQNAIWNCSNCYNVFHLRCIKKWARSPNAVVSGAEKDGWRCPGCQNLSFKFPNQYRCFCGKRRDPETSRMETPHSCGDVCQKNRGEGCKHPCNMLCHPGPCPECNAMVSKSCDCGKTKQTAKCCQSLMIKCEQVCERQLNCGKHFCQAKCHSGPCEMCEFVVKQDCYGKHEIREVVCGSENSFVDSYSCSIICSKHLDCGNHVCDKACHPGDCESCPRLPLNINHCPCGARSLLELGAEPRTSCLDPVPTCTAVCNKPLDCGPLDRRHRCEEICHEGPCGPCNGNTILTCSCLSMDKEFKCSEIVKETGEKHVFLCERRCNRKKSCGRHKCGQPCCVKEEHLCDLLCGRKLPCGLHKCTEACHKNNCPPCLMAGFDELTCYCGAEVMFPPIPCGTSPPECHRPCTREHGCNHPVRHNCHSDEKCAPCTELTKKMCMGNHVLRANIPCHLSDISCGMKCSKPLPCGEHTCIKTCHKGSCLEEGQTCTQPCQRKRELCEHTCSAPCHGESPCPQTACKAKVLLKCSCGHRESETMCSIGVNTENSEFQKITMQSLKDSIQGIMGDSSSVNIGKFNQARFGQGRKLECNEECALLDRNRRLALALEIQNPDLSSKLGNPSYSDFLKEFAKKDAPFVAGIEKVLSDLVQSAKQSKQSSRSHAFPSMNMNQRRLVHELAEFYGCQTQSYDYEPKKNVVATAMRDKCWLPSVTLTSLVQRELHPRAPPPIPHVFREEALRMTNLASKQSTLLLGERDREKSSSPTPEGWQVIGKKTKKASSSGAAKSAIGTIDKFESNLADICATGTINYESLSKESKDALKGEPVVDYFDFTVN